jgi:D-glycero-D-manno-heptose 1,7-bisphosphate phosphatase
MILQQGRNDKRSAGDTIQACDQTFEQRVAGPATPAVFLDRDGTLIRNYPHHGDPRKVHLLTAVAAALCLMRRDHYRLIVVTNQSGIARGLFSPRDLERVHGRLNRLLAARGAWIDAYYYCPHHVDGVVQALAIPCASRKPGQGMLLRAAAEWSIDLSRSWMIGDMPSDLEAGLRCGCRVVGVGDAFGRARGQPALDLMGAAEIIARNGALASSIGRAGRRAARRA